MGSRHWAMGTKQCSIRKGHRAAIAAGVGVAALAYAQRFGPKRERECAQTKQSAVHTRCAKARRTFWRVPVSISIEDEGLMLDTLDYEF